MKDKRGVGRDGWVEGRDGGGCVAGATAGPKLGEPGRATSIHSPLRS